MRWWIILFLGGGAFCSIISVYIYHLGKLIICSFLAVCVGGWSQFITNTALSHLGPRKHNELFTRVSISSWCNIFCLFSFFKLSFLLNDLSSYWRFYSVLKDLYRMAVNGVWDLGPGLSIWQWWCAVTVFNLEAELGDGVLSPEIGNSSRLSEGLSQLVPHCYFTVMEVLLCWLNGMIHCSWSQWHVASLL